MSTGSRLRFVSWAAVSSLPQAKKISNEDQLRVNAEYVARHGGQVVEELVVPGESRSIILLEEACRRIPAYDRLVQLIEARSFDVLVYLDRSRLGRKASLSMAIVELCHAANIGTCETESGGEIVYGATYDQLLVGAIKSVAAQQEINKLTERHRMGMLARVQRGEWPGKLPWGYKYVYSGDGQRSAVVDETAAPVIRRIFDLYLSGLGVWSIIRILNNEGAPSPGIHCEGWVYQTVRVITQRPWRYAGFVEYSLTGGERVRRPGRSPAIISPETAQRVEEMIIWQRGRRQTPVVHAFTGVVWCAVCNRPMRRSGEQLKDGRIKWRCRGGHSDPSAREDVLRETLIAAVKTLAEHLDDDVSSSVASQEEIELHREIESTKKGLDDAYARIERLDEAFAVGVMDLDRYARQIKKVQSRIDALTERMKSLQAQQGLVGTPADRLKRRQELVERGISVLDENAIEANAFLRTRVRLWCKNRRVIRVEFL